MHDLLADGGARQYSSGYLLISFLQKYAQGEERPDTFIGLVLIAGYLFSDGFTSTLQERLFKV
jgi:hypothetical protein